MFENDCIFDKFAVSASPDGNTFFTGNYNNAFHLIDADGTNTQYELNFKKSTMAKPMVPGKGAAISKMDYTRKVLAGDFNSKRNMVAVAALNCFFIYSMWAIYGPLILTIILAAYDEPPREQAAQSAGELRAEDTKRGGDCKLGLQVGPQGNHVEGQGDIIQSQQIRGGDHALA